MRRLVLSPPTSPIFYSSIYEVDLAILRTTEASKPQLLLQPGQQSLDHGSQLGVDTGTELHSTCRVGHDIGKGVI
jgi:hypothetical protein